MALGALALRPQLVGMGPLFPRIEQDLGVSHAVVGLLGTIPVLAMGLFAPFATSLAARVGVRQAVGVALALIAAFACARAAAPGVALVLLLTLPIGVGMALGNALMPLVVRASFHDRPLMASGGYTTGIQGGAAVAAVASVPIAQAFGGWRAAAAVLGAAAWISVLAWLLLARTRLPEPPARPQPSRRMPWRHGLAWQVAGLFCLLSMYYYGVGAWLAGAFLEHGWSEREAGALVAVFNLAAIPGGLTVVLVGERFGARRRWMLAATTLLTGAALLFIVAPAGGFAWAVMAGLGNGVMFPLAMTLPIDVARRAGDVGPIAGMMLGVGYTIGAAAPLVMGLFRDMTGSFTASLWLVVAIGCLLVGSAALLGPGRLRRGVGAGPDAGERAGVSAV
jgi:MFS transporter, CP family, cyanate transporter